MNDKEIIETLIAEYKKMPYKSKGACPPFIKDAICNYKTGRTNGMSLKTVTTLAEIVGFEIVIQKKQD